MTDLAGQSQIAGAVSAAAEAFSAWAGRPIEERISFLRAVEQYYRANKELIAQAISRETGKPFWESRLEVDSMAGKIPISIEAFQQRTAEQSKSLPDATGFTRYRPHGVMAVLGPFNMPGHLPNGHIVPALLAGNVIVFKPSEFTPGVGQVLADAFSAAKLPSGVFNLVQGGKEVGAALASDRRVNGILFTGSTAGGIALRRLCADDPGKILALEMGGNNPLIVHQTADLKAAAYTIIQSAYITAGQRCSCARRLILVDGVESESIIRQLIGMIEKIRVGLPTDIPEAFMGPVISAGAAQNVLKSQADLIGGGAVALVEARLSERSSALLTPGLLDVTRVENRLDVEIFGPLLQVIRVQDFAAAIREANNTRFGLSAGLISDSAELNQQFQREIRAGVLAWNRPMTGASSHLPFGGVGLSGNHRPGGFFAADYSAYPVAALESPQIKIPANLPPGITV